MALLCTDSPHRTAKERAAAQRLLNAFVRRCKARQGGRGTAVDSAPLTFLALAPLISRNDGNHAPLHRKAVATREFAPR